jgi:hypothetical protein
MTAALFAIVIECGKLFLKAKHVDPTDILLAFFAAIMSYKALLAMQSIQQKTVRPMDAVNVTPQQLADEAILSPEIVRPSHPIDRRGLVPASILGCLIVYATLQFPLFPLALLLGLLLYAVILWRKPALGFLILPALLPMLDLTPWSGRFFFDEFDLLILTTLSVLWVRPMEGHQSKSKPRMLIWVPLIGFLVLLVVSLLIGLWPFPAIDVNAFSQYYSPYNALRIAKGFFWAVLLSPFWLKIIGFMRFGCFCFSRAFCVSRFVGCDHGLSYQCLVFNHAYRGRAYRVLPGFGDAFHCGCIVAQQAAGLDNGRGEHGIRDKFIYLIDDLFTGWGYRFSSGSDRFVSGLISPFSSKTKNGHGFVGGFALFSDHRVICHAGLKRRLDATPYSNCTTG